MSFDRYWSDGHEDSDVNSETSNLSDAFATHSTNSSAPRAAKSSEEMEAERVFLDRPWPFYQEADPDEKPRPYDEETSLGALLWRVLVKKSPQFPFSGCLTKFPTNPTLEVNGVGPSTLPLEEEDVLQLIERCEKVQNNGKFWEFEDGSVTLDDDEWGEGFLDLSQLVARHLGIEELFEDCEEWWEILTESRPKLVIYGESGLPEQTFTAVATEEEGTEAVMVLQFLTSDPGAVVVHEGDDEEQHFESAKTSKSGLRYVVFSPSSKFRIENASDGLHTALIFSFRLLPQQRYLATNPSNQTIRHKFLKAMKNPYPTVLFLKNEYESATLVQKGFDALTGVDLARLNTLEQINTALPSSKRLRFIPVKLTREVKFYPLEYPTEWEEESCKDSITFLFAGSSGQTFSKDQEDDYAESGLEYLNPDNESLREMWMKVPSTTTTTMPDEKTIEQYNAKVERDLPSARSRSKRDIFGDNDCSRYLPDPPMPRKITQYFRFAIVIMPLEGEVEHIRMLCGSEGAVAYARQYSGHDPRRLRSLLQGSYDDAYLAINRFQSSQDICDAVVQLGDMTLVESLLEKACSLELFSNALVSSLSILVRGFGWTAIEAPFLACYEDVYIETFLDVMVRLIGALEGHTAQQSVLNSFFNEAQFWAPHRVGNYTELEILWKAVTHCEDKTALGRFVHLFDHIGPQYYENIIECIEKCSDHRKLSKRERNALSHLVSSRLEYLRNVVENRNKPSVWEISYAIVPEDPAVEAFLRSSERHITISGFSDANDARAYMLQYVGKSFEWWFSMESRTEGPGEWTVTLSKFQHKHAPGEAYWPGVDKDISNMMSKYFSEVNGDYYSRAVWTGRHLENV